MNATGKLCDERIIRTGKLCVCDERIIVTGKLCDERIIITGKGKLCRNYLLGRK